MATISFVNRRRPLAGRLCWWLPLAATALGPSPALARGAPEVDAAPVPLEEVVVTARKIEERAQDIPMSVQVLAGELLDVTNTTQLFDLQYSVPGLVVNTLGLHGAGFSLRAIADQGGSSLSVATHLNGVYLGSSNLAIAHTFDLARIEILKGPQGTLYGRNATGGSINLVPRQPQDQFNAAVEVAWGGFDTARLQGHVNLPFERSALRLAYVASEGDGYIRNSVDSRRFGEKDFRGLRLSYSVSPSERLQVDVMAQRVEDDGAAADLWLPHPDYLADPSDIRLATVTHPNPFLDTASDNVSVNVEYDLGFAALHSITGYARNELRDVDDCAGLPILSGCVRSMMPSRHEQLSQEFRLASLAPGAIDWLVGLYLYDDDSFQRYYQFTPVIDPDPTQDRFTTTGETTRAAFGQATLRLAARWKLTAGLRLSREDHRLETTGSGTEDSPTGVQSENSWTSDSWRADLEYAATEDLLVYAGVATGVKSGGVTVLPGGIVDTFGPEHLTAYETGVKSRWLDGQAWVNSAVFYYDFRDLQVNTSTITDSGLIFETDNAAAAEIYGLDTEGVLRLGARLSLSAGVVWLPMREFVAYRNDRTGDTLSGNKLVRAPEWTATTAIDYDWVLPRSGRVSARLEYSYRSDFYYTTGNDPKLAQDGFGLLNVYLDFEGASGKWHVFASGRNLGNEDYFNQVFLQASPGYPDTWEAGFGYRF